MHCRNSFFSRHQKLLLLAGSLYVIGLILSHATLPAIHVWVVACFFSIIMNFVYISEAVAQGRFIKTELAILVSLILLSVMGLLVHPLFVIVAIISHGLWDIAKHLGAGIPFFSWYTLSCAAVDVTYGLTLWLYWYLG